MRHTTSKGTTLHVFEPRPRYRFPVRHIRVVGDVSRAQLNGIARGTVETTLLDTLGGAIEIRTINTGSTSAIVTGH